LNLPASAATVERLADELATVIAERDRLRAVVERFVGFARSIGTTPTNAAVDSMTGLLAQALEALDVSPAIGDHAEETCVDSACPIHGTPDSGTGSPDE